MGFDTFPMITAPNSGWLQRVYASIITCPIACDTTYQPPTTHIGLRHFPPALIESTSHLQGLFSSEARVLHRFERSTYLDGSLIDSIRLRTSRRHGFDVASVAALSRYYQCYNRLFRLQLEAWA